MTLSEGSKGSMRIALVTNCTNRKALPPACSASAISGRTLNGFVAKWRAAIDRAPADLYARDLYLGRGFQEARRAWHITGADLYIASAGLGVVSANEKVPSYALTVSPQGNDSVTELLGLEDPALWWDTMTARRRSLLARCANADLVIVALSTPYLRMMRHELSAIAKNNHGRLRLIARSDPAALDPRLAGVWLPYDDRLNGRKSPIAGTESDFAQRALRHFVETILPKAPKANAKVHAQAVAEALSAMSKPRRKQRHRLSDDAIKTLMKRIGARVGAARMLRVLRDEKNVACEQSRCSALYKATFKNTAGKTKPRPQTKSPKASARKTGGVKRAH